jgi:hypothetical protein
MIVPDRTTRPIWLQELVISTDDIFQSRMNVMPGENDAAHLGGDENDDFEQVVGAIWADDESAGQRSRTQTGLSQPTEPSIWSSMSRDHSTAYSIGNVFVIGSMKPFTTIPIACSSERPRLIR